MWKNLYTMPADNFEACVREVRASYRHKELCSSEASFSTGGP